MNDSIKVTARYGVRYANQEGTDSQGFAFFRSFEDAANFRDMLHASPLEKGMRYEIVRLETGEVVE